MTSKSDTYHPDDALKRELQAADPGVQLEELLVRLKAAVKAAGGNTVVAKRAGIPLGSLNNYFQGREMRAQALIALSEACGVTLEWLGTGRGPMRPGAVPEQPPTKLFETVNMDLLGDAVEEVFRVIKERRAAPNGRQIAQLVSITYDQMVEAAWRTNEPLARLKESLSADLKR